MANTGEQSIPAGLGNAEHQRLLRAMTAYHARQPWTRAFLVFGSLGRGDWDDHSDLDLDVITDGTALAPAQEAARLCDAIGERPALIAPRRGDDANVVLESLTQFSIRYHPLNSTSPNILDSMRLLWGHLSLDEIREAGLRNRRASTEALALDALLALAVRAVLNARIALTRARPWSALNSLEEARGLLLEMYARARGLPRPLPAFERDSDPTLRAALAPLACQLAPEAIRAALLAACDFLLGPDLDRLTNGQAALTPGERHVLAAVLQDLQPPSLSSA
ncbi:MAG TPA: nucleotidyltransferase domain-containing protein [Ktedonobacterales bacterium]|nr:nucleotidyltransferase domain-containing protein [Ktedonobacterales bacterium]